MTEKEYKEIIKEFKAKKKEFEELAPLMCKLQQELRNLRQLKDQYNEETVGKQCQTQKHNK